MDIQHAFDLGTRDTEACYLCVVRNAYTTYIVLCCRDDASGCSAMFVSTVRLARNLIITDKVK